MLICKPDLMAKSTLTNAEKAFLTKVGAKIRDLRTSRKWTLEDVESHGWKNWQHLQKIESGKNITIVTLRKIAELYKISLSRLFESL